MTLSPNLRLVTDVRPRLVLVEWIDSGMAIGQTWKKPDAFVEEVHENSNFLLVTTVGYLLHEDDEHLVLAQSRDQHNDQYLNAQVIYRPCVQKIRNITQKKNEHVAQTFHRDQ